MTENITAIQSSVIMGTYIVVIIYSLSLIISTFICSIIIYLTYVTPNLHTPTNLLLSNTCLCTLIFSSVTAINSFFFFMGFKSTDWSCRIRGYLIYASVCLVIYSLVIQAISRLFWTVLYKHRSLLSMKCHFYLIFFQILFSFLFPLSSLITTNIVFRPFKLCFVPIQYKIHSLYLICIVYCVPVLTIIILYLIIYHHTTKSSSNVRRLLHGVKRDRRLARNILILLSIFVFGGTPLVIYVIWLSKAEFLPTPFFLFAIAAPPVAIIFEKIVIIILNKEIRKVIKQRSMAYYTCCFLSARVSPFSSSDNTNRTAIRTISNMIPAITAPKTQQQGSNSS